MLTGFDVGGGGFRLGCELRFGGGRSESLSSGGVLIHVYYYTIYVLSSVLSLPKRCAFAIIEIIKKGYT